MKILALDTSSSYLSLAVFDGDKLLVERRQKNRKLLMPTTASWIAKVLSEKRLTLKDLDGFIVGIGPGYFTSLRIGLATLKGFCFALQKPVVGVSSLDLISKDLNIKDGEICILIDAKRKLFYTAAYSIKDGIIRKIKQDSLLSLEAVCNGLKGRIVFAGDGISLAKEVILKHKQIDAVFADEKYWYPKAKFALELGKDRLKKTKKDSALSLLPSYLFEEDCQVQK